MKHRVYIHTEKSQEVSHKVNEDRVLFSEYTFMNDQKITLLVVADGIGGLKNGEAAARNAVQGFAESFYKYMAELYLNASDIRDFSIGRYADKLETVLKESICEANKRVYDGAEPFCQTGTTISAAVIVGNYAIVANVGDSPVYLYRSKTREIQLISKLHTQAERDVEDGYYERYSAMYYANEHRIYRSLGKEPTLHLSEVSIHVIGHLKEGDRILAGTDGAFGYMRELEMQELLECREDEEDFILSQLFEVARMDKDDDQSAILYIVGEKERDGA